MSRRASTGKVSTLKQLDAAIKRATAEMAKHKPESNAYVAARSTKNKAAMDKHREGRRAHERAEAKRRELRKQRAPAFPRRALNGLERPNERAAAAALSANFTPTSRSWRSSHKL